jgi:hypothetical protein
VRFHVKSHPVIAALGVSVVVSALPAGQWFLASSRGGSHPTASLSMPGELISPEPTTVTPPFGTLSPTPPTDSSAPIPTATVANSIVGQSRPGPSPSLSPSPGCRPRGRLLATQLPDWSKDNYRGSFGIRAELPGESDYPICPDETIPVFWATYLLDTSGVEHLEHDGTGALTYDHPYWDSALVTSRSGCLVYYVGVQDVPIPATIQPNELPFARWVLADSPQVEGKYYNCDPKTGASPTPTATATETAAPSDSASPSPSNSSPQPSAS